MRRGIFIGGFLAALIAVAPVWAQTPKIRLNVQPNKPPVVRIIPPAIAGKRAIAGNPGAKLIGIKPNGNNYVVTLRQQNKIRRVLIPGSP